MNTLRTAKSVFLLSIKEALAYRASMLFSLITYPATILISYFVWSSIFAASQTDTIAGFTLTQMISYYLIGTTILLFIWNAITRDLHEGVRRGDFIKYIIKPMSYPFFALFNNLGFRFLAVFIEFVPVILIITLVIGPSYILTQHLFLFLYSLIFAYAIFFLLSLLAGSLIFWLTNPNGVEWVRKIIMYVFSGGLIPLTFFPETIQKILLFIPFPYFIYMPTTIFVGNLEFAGITINFLTLTLLAGLQLLILLTIIFFVWRAAIKNFQGVGA